MVRWEHLAEVAFRLTESLDALDVTDSDGDTRAKRAGLESSLSALDDLLEVFGSDLDPLEELPEYALRRLVVGLRRSMTGLIVDSGE